LCIIKSWPELTKRIEILISWALFFKGRNWQLRNNQQFKKVGTDMQRLMDLNLDLYWLSRPPGLVLSYLECKNISAWLIKQKQKTNFNSES
jgi:hypothetical protein